MITVRSSETTIDYCWEYRQHLYRPLPGAEWTGKRGGYKSEDEAREGIERFLQQWPMSVDKPYRDILPREFRILRVEIKRDVLTYVTRDKETGDLVTTS